jgi:hypothetical protein
LQLASAMTRREYSDDEIRSLVKDLESLKGGQTAAAALVGCGSRAIPFLRSSLLRGKPRGVYQPRQLAAETLAELGAKEVLLEYLEQPPNTQEAVVRFGEDAVKSTAARELGRFLTDDVFERLQQLVLDRLLPGLVETLGAFERVEVMPYFLRALGDDICRASAEEAIRKLGPRALPFLIDAALKPGPSSDAESPSSRQRRRCSLRLVSELQLSGGGWLRLRSLLEDRDPEIAMTVSRIALDIAPTEDKERAVRRLIEMLPGANWFLRSEAQAALATHFDLARGAVESEIERRSASSPKERAMDMVLRLLVNLKNQAAQLRAD